MNSLSIDMSTSSGTNRCGTSTVNRGFSSHSHLLSPSVVKPGHWGAHSTLVWQVTSSTEVTPSRPRSHPGKPARPFWHNRERNCLPAPHIPWQPDQLDHWLHNGATNCFITFFKLLKLTFLTNVLLAPTNRVRNLQATNSRDVLFHFKSQVDLFVPPKI